MIDQCEYCICDNQLEEQPCVLRLNIRPVKHNLLEDVFGFTKPKIIYKNILMICHKNFILTLENTSFRRRKKTLMNRFENLDWSLGYK